VTVCSGVTAGLGLTRMAVPEVPKPPQPWSAQLMPFWTRMVQSCWLRVALGVKEMIRVWSETRGEARMVASRTTPKVPPPPVKYDL